MLAPNIIPFPTREPQQATFHADTASAAAELVASLRAGPYPVPFVIVITRPQWPGDRFKIQVR